GVESADKALATALRLIRQFAPEDYPNYQRAELVDDGSWLKGAITPTVRKPVARLRNGRAVMALGDAVTVNDPISGSGANDAVRMADRYIRSILDRGGRSFDAEWMQETFDGHYHEHGRHTMEFTKIMTGHMTDPLWKVFQAAAVSPGAAHTFVNVYTDIKKTLTWLTDMKAADAICDANAHELQGARFLTVAEAMSRFMPQPAAGVRAA
ncbi:MAG TPA: hypothetical protein VG477_04265, partial [Thermoanaerobaculia bacterium]|nr:hypothetical protein [Thermoanaerobaculia bacterium]